MEINKEKIKKDFEERPIIDYILYYFRNDDDKNDNGFSSVTVNSVQNFMTNNELDSKTKKEMKRKLSIFAYFMGIQQNFILDPYLLLGLDSNIIDRQDADEQIKDRYDNYLYKLQDFYKENGSISNRKSNVMASITEKLKYAYTMIKDKEAREKFNNLFNKKVKYSKDGLINPESIKIKIKEKDLIFIKIGDSIIANIGEIGFAETGTMVTRGVHIYALKGLTDVKPKILFGNLNLSLLDTLNYDDRYSNLKPLAEEIKQLQLSKNALKRAISNRNGYLGEVSYVDGKPKIIYDEADQDAVNRATTIVKLKLENINNVTVEKKSKGGETTKSEQQQPER